MKAPSILIVVIILLVVTQLESQNNALYVYTSYSLGKVDKRIDFLFDKYPPLNER